MIYYDTENLEAQIQSMEGVDIFNLFAYKVKRRQNLDEYDLFEGDDDFTEKEQKRYYSELR